MDSLFSLLCSCCVLLSSVSLAPAVTIIPLIILSLCPTFISYAKYASSQGVVQLSTVDLALPILLQPYRYSICGRLSSLSRESKWNSLLPMIIKDLQMTQQKQRNQGRTNVTSDEWIKIIAHDAEQRIDCQSEYRYLCLSDARLHDHHKNVLSRFHAIIKREEYHDHTQQRVTGDAAVVGTAAATAGSSSSVISADVSIAVEMPSLSLSLNPSQSDELLVYRYSILDLGSVNGICLDDIHIFSMQWYVLDDGMRISFNGNPIKTARRYFGTQEPSTMLNKRSKDEIQKLDRFLCTEFIFTQNVSGHAANNATNNVGLH